MLKSINHIDSIKWGFAKEKRDIFGKLQILICRSNTNTTQEKITKREYTTNVTIHIKYFVPYFPAHALQLQNPNIKYAAFLGSWFSTPRLASLFLDMN